MPFRYELDDLRRRIVVAVEGLFQAADIFAIMARQRAEHTWTYAILYDLRGMTGKPSVEELRQLMNEAAELRQGEGPRGPVALLATDQALYERLGTYAALGRSTTLTIADAFRKGAKESSTRQVGCRRKAKIDGFIARCARCVRGTNRPAVITFPPMGPFEPLLSLDIEPQTKADQENLGRGLRELMAEDPMLRVHTDQQTGRATILGMGELQLEIIIDRLKREFNVEATVGNPQVVYKETFTHEADGDGRYVNQTGGRGQYGHVRIHLYPGKSGTGYVFENEIVRGSIPNAFIKPIEDGIKEALTHGVLSGYAADLRSRTQGRATYSMLLEGYQPLHGGTERSDEDRSAPVTAPHTPMPRGKDFAVALPEPDDEALESAG